MTPVAATDQARAALIGRALADPKRLCVLETLAAGEASLAVDPQGRLRLETRSGVPLTEG